jgi:hypothetical protein
MVLLGMAMSAAAWGQHTNGYVYGGFSTIPGRQIYTYWHGQHAQVGGGGQVGVGRFTLGADITALIATGNVQRNGAIVSVGPGFHFFGKTERKLDPFVTGGLSGLVSRGAGVMAHYGGGVNYWFHPRVALRLEFRDHVWLTEGEQVHFTGGRIGLSFR